MNIIIRVKRTMALLLPLSCLVAGLTGCHQPEAPEYYGFQNIQLSKAGGNQATLAATLKFYNPNGFNIELKKAEMDVLLNGKPAGHSVLDSTVYIHKKDTFYVPVSLQLNLQGLLSNALQILMEKKVTIALDGRVYLRRGWVSFSRPFHYEEQENISDLQNLLQGM